MPQKLDKELQRPLSFNPLEPRNIGKMLRQELEGLETQEFPPAAFRGAGLYALYYTGELDIYSPIKGTQVPIYVGKAEAGNSSFGNEPSSEKKKLTDRIRKHANSVLEVETAHGNLSRRDFVVRALSLDDAWIVLGERALLRAYRPVLWNTIATGFGSNEPGTGRTNARSAWDTIHAGRRRAGLMPNRQFTYDEMIRRVIEASAISAMKDGTDKEQRLDALQANRPRVIWAPPKRSDEDKRIRVADLARFLSELRRLGREPEEVDFREVVEDLPRPPIGDSAEVSEDD